MKKLRCGDLNSFYRITVERLLAKYHSYPSNQIGGGKISADERDEVSVYERMANDISNSSVNGDVPPGKLVI